MLKHSNFCFSHILHLDVSYKIFFSHILFNIRFSVKQTKRRIYFLLYGTTGMYGNYEFYIGYTIWMTKTSLGHKHKGSTLLSYPVYTAGCV